MPRPDYFSFFIRLLDCPNSYQNFPGALVQVNQTMSGLQFTTLGGNAGKIMKVNDLQDGFDFVDYFNPFRYVSTDDPADIDTNPFDIWLDTSFYPISYKMWIRDVTNELWISFPSGGSSAGPIDESNTFALQRANESLAGNSRGSMAIDFQYSKTNAVMVAAAELSAILSGQNNTNNGFRSCISGGKSNIIRQQSMLYDDGYNGGSFIGAGYGNICGTNTRGSFIGAGYCNQIQGNDGATDHSMGIIVGGNQNAILCGYGSQATYCNSLVGGQLNSITGHGFNFIGGGSGNYIGGTYGAVWNGTISGGAENGISANGSYGCVPGGRLNLAGANSFACGWNAQALTGQSFAFADGQLTQCGRANMAIFGVSGGFTVRNNAGVFDLYSNNGVWFSTPNPYCYLGSDGVWYSASSRTIKDNFRPVGTFDILDKIYNYTLEEWNYKETPEENHIGVTSEDFHNLFGYGKEGGGLNALDVCGVLWSAVQALTCEVRSLQAKVANQ